MDTGFRKAVDILSEYIKEQDVGVNGFLKFASNAISIYVINAENENTVGFSESLFRETVVDLLAEEEEDSNPNIITQIPPESTEYNLEIQRKRRGSVSASGNPFATLTEHPKPEHVTAMLLKILADTRLIARTMDAEQMKKLVATMYVQDVKKGEELIRQGEYGKTMYLVESGEFQILQNGKLKATLRRDSLFGEISLLYSCPRTASVVCTINSKVWVVDSDAYTAILMVEQRRDRELICHELEKHKKYASLSETEKNKVLNSTHLMHFSRGERVEVSDSGVFLVLETVVKPNVSTNEKEKIGKEVRTGEVIHKGTVCSTDVTLLFIPDLICRYILG